MKFNHTSVFQTSTGTFTLDLLYGPSMLLPFRMNCTALRPRILCFFLFTGTSLISGMYRNLTRHWHSLCLYEVASLFSLPNWFRKRNGPLCWQVETRFFLRQMEGSLSGDGRHMSYPLSWAGGNHALLVPPPGENSHDHPVVLPTLWLRKITSRYCSYTVFTSEVMLATGQQSKFKIILRVSNSGFVLLL